MPVKLRSIIGNFFIMNANIHIILDVLDYPLFKEVLDYILFKGAFDYQHLVSILEDSNRRETPAIRSKRIADK